MRCVRGLVATLLVLMISIFTVVLGTAPEGRADAPADQMTWAVHISLAPTWFDPAETLGIITPFMVMYAMHDALAKAMPGNPTAPSLAESWQVSPDGGSLDLTSLNPTFPAEPGVSVKSDRAQAARS